MVKNVSLSIYLYTSNISLVCNNITKFIGKGREKAIRILENSKLQHDDS